MKAPIFRLKNLVAVIGLLTLAVVTGCGSDDPAGAQAGAAGIVPPAAVGVQPNCQATLPGYGQPVPGIWNGTQCVPSGMPTSGLNCPPMQGGYGVTYPGSYYGTGAQPYCQYNGLADYQCRAAGGVFNGSFCQIPATPNFMFPSQYQQMGMGGNCTIGRQYSWNGLIYYYLVCY